MKALRYHLIAWILITLSIVTLSCGKENEVIPSLPELRTFIAKDIDTTSASIGGIIVNDGGSTILSKGICWSKTPNPTVNEYSSLDVSDSDTILSQLKGLEIYTTYYVRGYATNGLGTSYGNETSFTTQGGTVTDSDGNIYNTISIGSQVWMAENLKTTKYRNGDSIQEVIDDYLWQSPWEIPDSSGGAFCYYKNDIKNGKIYGPLYNWYATKNHRGLAPEGWHVATEEDWKILNSVANGGSLKEAGTIHWKSPNTGATNESGFTALPGGSRSHVGTFDDLHKIAFFWTSSSASSWGFGGYGYYRYLQYQYAHTESLPRDARIGCSVRCVRD